MIIWICKIASRSRIFVFRFDFWFVYLVFEVCFMWFLWEVLRHVRHHERQLPRKKRNKLKSTVIVSSRYKQMFGTVARGDFRCALQVEISHNIARDLWRSKIMSITGEIVWVTITIRGIQERVGSTNKRERERAS